ncbi:MAG: EamA family transporter, partial [Verrucomicrobia bacterium]
MKTESNQPPAPLWLVLAAFAAVYVIWGSTYLGIRYAVESIPPFLMAATR